MDKGDVGRGSPWWALVTLRDRVVRGGCGFDVVRASVVDVHGLLVCCAWLHFESGRSEVLWSELLVYVLYCSFECIELKRLHFSNILYML